MEREWNATDPAADDGARPKRQYPFSNDGTLPDAKRPARGGRWIQDEGNGLSFLPPLTKMTWMPTESQTLDGEWPSMQNSNATGPGSLAPWDLETGVVDQGSDKAVPLETTDSMDETSTSKPTPTPSTPKNGPPSPPTEHGKYQAKYVQDETPTRPAHGLSNSVTNDPPPSVPADSLGSPLNVDEHEVDYDTCFGVVRPSFHCLPSLVPNWRFPI
jgi:hypothetical protein